MRYIPLEPSAGAQLGLENMVSFDTGTVSTFYGSISFLWSLGIMICVAGASYALIRSSFYRAEASEAGVRKSKEWFKQAVLGLLGVLLLAMFIDTINKDLRRADFDFGVLTTEKTPTSSIAPVSGYSGTSVQNLSCASIETVQQLQKNGNVCGNTSCTALSGCNYSQYLPIINNQASLYGVDPKLAIVIMCRESKAKKEAQNTNPNGTYDCGLMQINQNTPCDQSILDPEKNIAIGIQKIKSKSSSQSVNQIYPGVPEKAGLFASYNCCANGTLPNAPSNDCNQSSGFSSALPKWACPINPGEGRYNMCAVNNYACDLVACLKEL